MSHLSSLETTNIGMSIASEVLTSPPMPLAEVPLIMGTGVYALYYHGKFNAYKTLSDLYRTSEGGDHPIYVSKVERSVLDLRHEHTISESRSLIIADRLRQHSDSIQSAENISVADFSVRYKVLDPILIPLAETMLMTQTMPLWNRIIPGIDFVNSTGNPSGVKTRWDTIHPGRLLSKRLLHRHESARDIAQEASEYLRSRHHTSPNY